MSRDDLHRQQLDNRRDGQALMTADIPRLERKSSDDRNSQDYRGNRRGNSQFEDDRREYAGNRNGDITEDRRGNQMKEEKAQLNHSSDPD
jgi:hypothetical protein